jgi:hypothetical protein
LYAGPELPVYTRVAGIDDGVVIDLGDESWSTAVVTPLGWHIDPDPSVNFRRPRGLAAFRARVLVAR